MSSATSSDTLTYEQRRERNIVRNKRMFSELGLHAAASQPAAGPRPRKQKRGTRQSKPKPPPAQGWRRSSRVAHQPALDYREPSAREGLEEDRRARSASAAAPGRDEDEDVEGGMVHAPLSLSAAAAAAAAAHRPPSEGGSANSIKNLDVGIARLDGEYLGEHIPAFQSTQIKAGVMRLAAAPAVPKFSRMSGIQAWRNAVMLFVNVDRSTYNNVFLEGGSCMVWYAQNTQHADTPVIQRLLRAPDAAADAASVPVKVEGAGKGKGKGTDGKRLKGTAVLLFCRLPGEEYIYCGRLGYCRHNPERRPMRFVWRLLDFAALRTKPAYKDMFDDPVFQIVDVTQ